MLFIHNSKLGSHGRLKSTNCLVDNRWMLKVTDYGVAKYLTKPDTEAFEEHQLYKGTFGKGYTVKSAYKEFIETIKKCSL